MVRYILYRILLMIPTIIAIGVITFFLIELPPGDWLTTYIAGLRSSGEEVDAAQVAALEKRYGLDKPVYVRFFKWASGIILEGDFGVSLNWNRPVSKLIWSRLGLTLVLSTSALIVHWLVAFPIGIYSAVRRYSVGDYVATTIAFISAALPHFLVALVILYFLFVTTGSNFTGLVSSQYAEQPWSWAKFVDAAKHVSVSLFILGFLGSAYLVRIMRANVLDELNKPYVTTGRAKGLQERRLTLKYPVRVALNPFVSTIGWSLPGLISGTTITSIVLGLPTTGPLLLRALQAQDMYLAGSFLLILSVLTVIGTAISDILLAWLDPRIRYD
jgi:peptide/nickel transport system permease protein